MDLYIWPSSLAVRCRVRRACEHKPSLQAGRGLSGGVTVKLAATSAPFAGTPASATLATQSRFHDHKQPSSQMPLGRKSTERENTHLRFQDELAVLVDALKKSTAPFPRLKVGSGLPRKTTLHTCKHIHRANDCNEDQF